MTNAEKLAKDTNFMVSALISYCEEGDDCDFCRFYKGGCIIGGYKRSERIDAISKWLESEAEDAEIH